MEGILNFVYGEHHKIDPRNYKDVYDAASIFAIPSATAFYKVLMKDQERQNEDDHSSYAHVTTENTCKVKDKNRNVTEEDEEKNEASDGDVAKWNKRPHNNGGHEILRHSRSGKNTSVVLKQDKRHQGIRVQEVMVPVVQQQAVEDRKRLLTRSLPTCNVCGRRFLRIGFLKRHKERKHFRNRDKRVYKCEFCPKVCRTPKDIKLHRRRHTGMWVCQ